MCFTNVATYGFCKRSLKCLLPEDYKIITLGTRKLMDVSINIICYYFYLFLLFLSS